MKIWVCMRLCVWLWDHVCAYAVTRSLYELSWYLYIWSWSHIHHLFTDYHSLTHTIIQTPLIYKLAMLIWIAQLLLPARCFLFPSRGLFLVDHLNSQWNCHRYCSNKTKLRKHWEETRKWEWWAHLFSQGLSILSYHDVNIVKVVLLARNPLHIVDCLAVWETPANVFPPISWWINVHTEVNE